MDDFETSKAEFFDNIAYVLDKGLARQGDRVLSYTFESASELNAAGSRFSKLMNTIGSDALSRAPDDWHRDPDYLKQIPRGLMITKDGHATAIVIADPLEGLGVALRQLGRPMFQMTV